jgi:hypothetical protein
MVGSTLTSFDGFLKDNYTDDEIIRQVNEDHVFLDMQNTGERGVGRRLIVPLLDGNPQGLGATVAKAQAGAEQTSGGNIQGDDWTILWGDYSAHVDIGRKVMAASANDLGAFFQNKQEEIDGLYRAFGDTMSSYMLRDSGHALGSGTNSSGVQTLVNQQDIVNFEVGQIIDVSANDGTSTSHTLIASSASGYVVSVNYNTGKFSVSATSGGAAATPTNWTGTMYYFRTGDFGGDTSPTRIVLGYGAWNPAADPTSTTFEGINRAVNIVRRSGIRLVAADVAGLGVEQRLKKLAVWMTSRGKRPNKCLVHPEQWDSLATSLESRGNRAIDGKVGVFSFNKLQLSTPAGMIEVYAEKFMSVDTAYMFDQKAIGIKTLKGFPAIVNDDGLNMLRRTTSNDFEFRLDCFPAYYHKSPSATGRCPLVAP